MQEYADYRKGRYNKALEESYIFKIYEKELKSAKNRAFYRTALKNVINTVELPSKPYKVAILLIYRIYVKRNRIAQIWRFWGLSNILPKAHYSLGRLYLINSPTSILRYQHNLHINPVSRRLTLSRQYLLKLVRGISRSLQILFLLIPFSSNISFIRRCKLP